MQLFNVGNRVRIRPDLHTGLKNSQHHVNNKMIEVANLGATHVISKVETGSSNILYYILEGMDFGWDTTWLIPAVLTEGELHNDSIVSSFSDLSRFDFLLKQD